MVVTPGAGQVMGHGAILAKNYWGRCYSRGSLQGMCFFSTADYDTPSRLADHTFTPAALYRAVSPSFSHQSSYETEAPNGLRDHIGAFEVLTIYRRPLASRISGPGLGKRKKNIKWVHSSDFHSDHLKGSRVQVQALFGDSRTSQ